jgi:hypothetical protein
MAKFKSVTPTHHLMIMVVRSANWLGFGIMLGDALEDSC